MDIYGGSLENNFSGEVDISGDLVVSGDGTFENITVTDTATISTLITEQELKVVDPIILMGKDNPADNVNLGILEEYTDGTKKFSGLLRDRTTKQQYLLEGATPEPGTTTDLTLLPRGHLNIGSLTNANYTLPTADGTPGQIISTNGAGVLSFTADTGGTLQSSYDASVDPQITTTIANDTLVLKQGVGVPAPVLQVQDNTGATILEVSSGTVSMPTNVVRQQPLTGQAFQSIQAPGAGFSTLGVGQLSNTATTCSLQGQQASVTVNGSTSSDLFLISGTDEYKFENLASNDKLILEKNDVVRVSYEATETSFGPDGFVVLRDTGELECKDCLVKSFNPTIQFEGSLSTSQSLINLGTPANTQNAFIQLYSNTASAIDLASEKRAFLRWGNQNVPIDEFCIERDFNVGVGDVEFIFRPFGGATKRIPITIPISGDEVKINKLDVNGAYTLPTVDGTAGQYLATDGSGVVTWESLPESSYGEQYFSGNTTVTALPVQNQFEDILGTRIAGDLKDFTQQATTLTYTGTETKTMKYSFNAGIELDDGKADDFEIAIFKNNIQLPEGVQAFSLDDTNNFPRSISTSCITEMATNDTITVKIRCTTDNENVIFLSLMSNVVSVTSGQGGGGGGSGTLQDAYNLSVSPEITTDAGQGLTLRSGGASAFEEVLKIQTSAGTQTASITASGIANVNIINATGNSVLQGGVKIGNVLATEDYDLPVNNVGASDGDILKYDLASRTLQFSTPFAYARTTQAVISNNALELALTDTGNPDLVIPGGTLKVGDAYRITSTGQFRNGGILDNATFRVRMQPLGPIVSQILFGAVAIGSPQYYKLEVLLTARTVGGSSTFAQTISFFVNNQTVGSSSAPVSTFNSLVDIPFAVSAQWSNIGVNNILTQQQLTIEKIA